MCICLCECPPQVYVQIDEWVCVCLWWMNNKFDPLLQGQRRLSGVLFITLYVFFWGTVSLWICGSHTGKSGSQKAPTILLLILSIKSGVSGTCGDVWFVGWVLSSEVQSSYDWLKCSHWFSHHLYSLGIHFKNAVVWFMDLGPFPSDQKGLVFKHYHECLSEGVPVILLTA